MLKGPVHASPRVPGITKIAKDMPRSSGGSGRSGNSPSPLPCFPARPISRRGIGGGSLSERTFHRATKPFQVLTLEHSAWPGLSARVRHSHGLERHSLSSTPERCLLFCASIAISRPAGGAPGRLAGPRGGRVSENSRLRGAGSTWVRHPSRCAGLAGSAFWDPRGSHISPFSPCCSCLRSRPPSRARRDRLQRPPRPLRRRHPVRGTSCPRRRDSR